MTILSLSRPINNILGFSKETLVAVVANVEGREWRRQCSNRGNTAEHPRASTSDDVECFFSMLRDILGRNFTSKQVQLAFRKVCSEFDKRLDPKLPYYYHTAAHTRYSEGPLPAFDITSSKKKRKSRKNPIRETPAAFVIKRASLPVHGSTSVRIQFHNHPVDLPPVTNEHQHTFEYSYA